MLAKGAKAHHGDNPAYGRAIQLPPDQEDIGDAHEAQQSHIDQCHPKPFAGHEIRNQATGLAHEFLEKSEALVIDDIAHQDHGTKKDAHQDGQGRVIAL